MFRQEAARACELYNLMTAQTNFSSAFAEAASRRGGRTLFVRFGSGSNEVIRNLASAGIRSARYVKNGRLSMPSARNITGSAATSLARIKTLATRSGI